MTRHLLTTGSTFEINGAYSRAVVQEPFCFMSGVTGYDYGTMEISDDLTTQTLQIFETIERVLTEAGFELRDVVSMVCILDDRSTWPQVYDILNQKLSDVRPTLLTYEAKLIEPAMKIELQVTALRRAKE